jgi:hypothetical protein
MRVLPQDFIVDKNIPQAQFYTTQQYQEFSDENYYYRLSKDSDKVFAKCLSERLPKDSSSDICQTKYYVKGNNGKDLFDPFPKYALNDNRGSFIDKVCKPDHKFIEVTKSTFDKYINFLKTSNRQYYIGAQKEIM